MATNYFDAKKKFKSLEKQYAVDPNEKLFFLKASLENNDITYFKKEIKRLIKYFGYRQNEFVNKDKEMLSELLVQKSLDDWMQVQSNKLYPRWVANNSKGFEVQKKIDELVVSDQRRVYIYVDDSSCSEASMANLRANDLENYHQLFLLWDENHILPNNFDHGVGTTQKWSLILWHLLKSDDHEQIWKQFLPHLERMYFAGKVGDSFFRDYDYILATWFGYQYYGFQGDLPVKDPEHLEERRKKYGF